MSLSDKDKRIAYAIVSHLQSQTDSHALDDEASEGVTVALQCLCAAYNIDLGDESHKEKYGVKTTLEEMFSDLHPPAEVDKAKADALKQEGNAHLKVNKFDEAISCYTRAIEIDPQNATYHCNRAAAYIKLQDYEKALVDCEKAVELDPQYARAHGRMGYVYSSLQRYEESKACFEKAIKLDPGNESYRGNLDAVNEQLRPSNPPQGGGAAPQGSGAGQPAGGAPGGRPGPEGLGGLLGPGGLSGLLQNPGMMNLATSMMQNPAFMNMASRMMERGPPDPANMEGMMPEMVRTAQEMQRSNPELVENLRQQFAQSQQQMQQDGAPPPNTDSSETKEQ